MSMFPCFTRTYHKTPYPAIDPTKPENSCAGKTVLITGGNKGIGAAIAKAFVQAHASNVVILGRDKASLATAKADLEAIISSSSTTQVHTFVADVVDKPAIDTAFSTVTSQISPIDIFVNNAGVMASHSPMAEIPLDAFWRDFEVNVKGGLIATQAFLRHCDKERQPILLNVSAGSAHVKYHGSVGSYVASKNAFIRVLDHVEAENPWLRVHQLHPGIFKTGIATKPGPSMPPESLFEDISIAGAFCVWISSPEAAFLKGRFVWAQWDVEEMKARKQEILDNPNLLSLSLGGWPFEGPAEKVLG